MDHYKLFIDGEFVESTSGEVMESIDPGTGIPFATVAKANAADAEKAVMAAKRAFDSGKWSGLSPRERADIIYIFADEIAKQSMRIAVVEAMDSGQVIRLSGLWGMMSQMVLRNFGYYAAHKFPWQEEFNSGNVFAPGRDYIRREPIGVCVGIVPWNFPIYQAVWKIAHSIVMGNTVVVKPASATPLTACILGEAALAAGIPKGVINILPGPGAELGNVLCTHPAIDKVSLTGSTEVGRMIMKLASDTVKKVTLELGGKSANIILDDADLNLAASGAAFGTFMHQGQVCESGTRILVSSKIHDQFVEKLKERTEALRVGYQLLPESHMGPLVSADQISKVEQYVNIGQEEGARLVTGGKRVEVPGMSGGYYFAPTIFANVKNDMRIAQEEIFGPVVCVLKYDDDEEAISIANDSIYGLAGGVFSSNMARAQRIAGKVRTGTMWINSYHAFGDFAPFGGYKQSGVGRELGETGLKEYTQVKRVHVCSYANPDTNFTLSRLSTDKQQLGSFLPFNCHTNVVSGKGCLASISKEVVNLHCSRALILTDQGVLKAGLTQLAQDALGDFCVGVFDRIEQDTALETVDEAVALARKINADCIVSVGGGSVIDTGKAVCVTLKNGGKADDHITLMRLAERQTPHIVIPTTSGTGSEVTNACVIKSKTSDRKVFILDHYIVPDVAILDPCFTVTLPPSLTAQTAMDAMTHAIESLSGAMGHPFSDANSMHAIRLIKENLPKAIANGHDEDARSNLQTAATMGGWAINMTQTALAHSMAHTIGALYNLPHGMACGIMLPKVMRFNVDHATDKLAMAAEALGVRMLGMNDREAALAAADDIEKLMKSVNHPTRLRDVGVPKEGLETAALHALGDATVLFNPRPITDPAQVLDLYKQAY
jgi:acyl-CoA reductase-like NAD-dependent aldehyde dehydrogenase/alcohol dehydrogenase class IV